MSPSAPAAIGEYRHWLTLENPGTPVPDGDGGFTEGWTLLSPGHVWGAVDPATAADAERLTAGTTISTLTHLIRIPFHPGVTTETRITYGAHVYEVTGYRDPDLRERELIITAEELLP